MINRFTVLRPCLQPVTIRHFSRVCSPLNFKYTPTIWKNKGETHNKSNLKHDQNAEEQNMEGSK